MKNSKKQAPDTRAKRDGARQEKEAVAELNRKHRQSHADERDGRMTRKDYLSNLLGYDDCK
jgi:hypothetical protein